MRLFIAIDLPDDLKKTLGRLRADIPGARWVPFEQIHLTLAFLGEVDEKTVGLLTRELAHRQAAAFELCFTGVGCFPNRHRPRVLWIGLEPEPCLTDLAAEVHEAVLACDIPQEERPFSPHITLARFKFPASRETGAFLDQHQKLELPSFSAQEFILFQSRLTPKGAVHTPIKNFALAASGGNNQPGKSL